MHVSQYGHGLDGITDVYENEILMHRNYVTSHRIDCGPVSVVGIATGYGLDGAGSNLGGGEIFRTYPERPLGPTQAPLQWVPGLSRE
jgi:hypothetical protein